MKVTWSPEALEDIGAAVDYLTAHDAVEAAIKLVTRVTALADRLANEPIDGPEHILAGGERVRGWPSPPLRLYYQRTADRLIIVLPTLLTKPVIATRAVPVISSGVVVEEWWWGHHLDRSRLSGSGTSFVASTFSFGREPVRPIVAEWATSCVPERVG